MPATKKDLLETKKDMPTTTKKDMLEKCKTLLAKPFFHDFRTLFGLWLLLPVVWLMSDELPFTMFANFE